MRRKTIEILPSPFQVFFWYVVDTYIQLVINHLKFYYRVIVKNDFIFLPFPKKFYVYTLSVVCTKVTNRRRKIEIKQFYMTKLFPMKYGFCTINAPTSLNKHI